MGAALAATLPLRLLRHHRPDCNRHRAALVAHVLISRTPLPVEALCIPPGSALGSPVRLGIVGAFRVHGPLEHTFGWTLRGAPVDGGPEEPQPVEAEQQGLYS